MKSNLSSIRQRLDACKKEVFELEQMNNNIKEALDTIPFRPQHRQQIESAFLRYGNEIAMLKSEVMNTELISTPTEKEEQATSKPVSDFYKILTSLSCRD